MAVKGSLYDRDFFAWSREQAALLRDGRAAEADLEHIAEEIESMGKTEKRELVSRLTVLLLHLLKWRFQPSGRGASWRLSIANARDEIADLVEDNPSLKAQLDEVTASAYRYARRKAAIETELGEERFPARSPWSFAEATAEDFWPD
jgi:predicted  nucleic acid-binding Zn-ribbon protein